MIWILFMLLHNLNYHGNKSDDFILNRSWKLSFLIKKKQALYSKKKKKKKQQHHYCSIYRFLRKKHKISIYWHWTSCKNRFTKEINDVLLLVTDLTGKSYRLKKHQLFQFCRNLKVIPCLFFFFCWGNWI